MRPFRHLMPALRLHHGPDSLAEVARELERLGCRRAVIVCGASLSRNASVMTLLREALGERCAGVHAGVQAHSPLPAVLQAAEHLRALQADAVIAVGGGSAVVTARAASIVLAEGSSVHALCTSRDAAGVLRSPRLNAAKLPQFVIPTTPTTATLKAGSAVLDPEDGGRLALFDPKTRAQAVFVHPRLLSTPPAALVVSAGLNTLAMAFEGLMSARGDPFSDALLIHATRLLVQQLPDAARGDAVGPRADLMTASLMCGHGTDYTGAGIAIPLGHAVSARFHVDNGLANAIVLPHVVRFNEQAARAGLEKLALALDLAGTPRPADAVAGALATLLQTLGTPTRLRDIGVTRDALPAMAEVSMEDWFVRDNPRRVEHAGQLHQVLQDAW
jgi:alcohol dehydrogenase class IV